MKDKKHEVRLSESAGGEVDNTLVGDWVQSAMLNQVFFFYLLVFWGFVMCHLIICG